MECAYCSGHVVVVDAWKNYKVVECAACGVRYDVRDEKEDSKSVKSIALINLILIKRRAKGEPNEKDYA